MGNDLRLQLSEDGADAERLAVMAGYLRAELLRLDVDDVLVVPGGKPPPDARGASITTAGALLVALGQASQGLLSVVSSVRNWLRRGDGGARAVRLELDGDVLELSLASEADQDRLVELFIRRHATPSAPS